MWYSFIKKFTIQDTNLVKGVGILFMYFHHFYLSADRFEKYSVSFYPLTKGQGIRLAVFLKICVAIFLFLSGYGMYVSQKKENFRSLAAGGLKRYLKLILSFMLIFWIIQIVFFYTGRCFTIYGSGIRALIYVFIDMIGLAHLLNTPTYLGTWWYMSLISLVIWIFPLVYKGMKKQELLSLLFWTLLCWSPLSEKYELFRWMPSFIAGILFGQHKLFEKISALFEKQNGFRKMLIFLGMSLLALSLYYFRKVSWVPIGLRDALIVSILAVYLFLFISGIPYLNTFLAALGAHSMTMFLTHTLIRQTFFKDFSYSFGWAYLNVAVVLAVTWCYSWLIDTFAAKSGYNRQCAKLAAKAASWIERL